MSVNRSRVLLGYKKVYRHRCKPPSIFFLTFMVFEIPRKTKAFFQSFLKTCCTASLRLRPHSDKYSVLAEQILNHLEVGPQI